MFEFFQESFGKIFCKLWIFGRIAPDFPVIRGKYRKILAKRVFFYAKSLDI